MYALSQEPISPPTLSRSCRTVLCQPVAGITTFSQMLLVVFTLSVGSTISLPTMDLRPNRSWFLRMTSQRVSITLYNNLAGVLDHSALIQADCFELIIIAVGSLMVGRLIGTFISVTLAFQRHTVWQLYSVDQGALWSSCQFNLSLQKRLLLMLRVGQGQSLSCLNFTMVVLLWTQSITVVGYSCLLSLAAHGTTHPITCAKEVIRHGREPTFAVLSIGRFLRTK